MGPGAKSFKHLIQVVLPDPIGPEDIKCRFHRQHFKATVHSFNYPEKERWCEQDTGTLAFTLEAHAFLASKGKSLIAFQRLYYSNL